MSKLLVALQYILPKRLLTVLAGSLARRRHFASQWLITKFIKIYQVNMAEAANSDPASYASFNDFFTRRLKDNARPLAAASFTCPVDGKISQLGKIEQQQIFQAKGHNYSAAALLGGDAQLADNFSNGSFATIYLSPTDYHRIHMPCAGRLQQMIYIPGDLFSVNPATAAQVPGLFARNERVVAIFEAEFGPFAMVLVGATIVGSMATSWHGVVNPPRLPSIKSWDYSAENISLAKGEEMGKFLLGSTVVLLFPPDVAQFNPTWQAGLSVQMGQAMANAA